MMNQIQLGASIKPSHLLARSLAIAFALTFLVAIRPAQGQTFTVLHSFAPQGDGYEPQSGLIMDARGNLYGTTFKGGQTTTTAAWRTR